MRSRTRSTRRGIWPPPWSSWSSKLQNPPFTLRYTLLTYYLITMSTYILVTGFQGGRTSCNEDTGPLFLKDISTKFRLSPFTFSNCMKPSFDGCDRSISTTCLAVLMPQTRATVATHGCVRGLAHLTCNVFRCIRTRHQPTKSNETIPTSTPVTSNSP